MIEEEWVACPFANKFANKSVEGKPAKIIHRGVNGFNQNRDLPVRLFPVRSFHHQRRFREGITFGTECHPAPKIADGKPTGVKLPNVANRASGGRWQNVRESLSVGISHFTDDGSWLISAEFESRCCCQRSLCWRVMVACVAE